MAAAKGIAYGSGLPLIPVPTYEAFAFQMTQILPDKLIFVIANKVNKEEVYFAKFQIRGNSYIFVDDLVVIKNSLFKEKVKDLDVFGNAAVLINKKVKFPETPDPKFIAKWAVEFGNNNKTYDYDFLEPNYLKNFIVKEKSK